MNIGILGTGSIARTMAAEFAKVPAFRCEAVCSRQQATGEALAQQFGIPKVYTDYDAMLADPDIELVYIATPNSLHYAQTKAALLAGKNVLCEKPSLIFFLFEFEKKTLGVFCANSVEQRFF